MLDSIQIVYVSFWNLPQFVKELFQAARLAANNQPPVSGSSIRPNMRDVAGHPDTTPYRKLESLAPNFKQKISRSYITPLILTPMNMPHRASFRPDVQFENAQNAMAVIAGQLAGRELGLMGAGIHESALAGFADCHSSRRLCLKAEQRGNRRSTKSIQESTTVNRQHVSLRWGEHFNRPATYSGNAINYLLSRRNLALA
jgi:hypothetical protein